MLLVLRLAPFHRWCAWADRCLAVGLVDGRCQAVIAPEDHNRTRLTGTKPDVRPGIPVFYPSGPVARVHATKTRSRRAGACLERVGEIERKLHLYIGHYSILQTISGAAVNYITVMYVQVIIRVRGTVRAKKNHRVRRASQAQCEPLFWGLQGPPC